MAAIECLWCALFAIGAIKEMSQTEQSINPTLCIKKDNDIKKITPTTTAEKIYSKFGNILITTTLKDLFDTVSTEEDTKQYKEWKEYEIFSVIEVNRVAIFLHQVIILLACQIVLKMFVTHWIFIA